MHLICFVSKVSNEVSTSNVFSKAYFLISLGCLICGYPCIYKPGQNHIYLSFHGNYSTWQNLCLKKNLDDIDIDISYVSYSILSYESDPIVQQLGYLPQEMIVQDEQSDEQTDEVTWLPHIPLTSLCCEDWWYIWQWYKNMVEWKRSASHHLGSIECNDEFHPHLSPINLSATQEVKMAGGRDGQVQSNQVINWVLYYPHSVKTELQKPLQVGI